MNHCILPRSLATFVTAWAMAIPLNVRAADVDLESLRKSVVTVSTAEATGSGFLIDGDGTIATNLHVVQNSPAALIVLYDGTTLPVAGFTSHIPSKDIVLLKAGEVPDAITPLSLSDEEPRIGGSVYAIGNPKQLAGTVTNGIVSAIRRESEIASQIPGSKATRSAFDPTTKWIQTSAAISPGSSGGPLVNDVGLVVGMNTWTRVDGQNLNFALSADDIRLAIDGRDALVRRLSDLPSLQTDTPPHSKASAERTLEYWNSRIDSYAKLYANRDSGAAKAFLKRSTDASPSVMAAMLSKAGPLFLAHSEFLGRLPIKDVDPELLEAVVLERKVLRESAETFSAVARGIRSKNVATLSIQLAKLPSLIQSTELALEEQYDSLRATFTLRYGIEFPFHRPTRELVEANTPEADIEKRASDALKLALQLKEKGLSQKAAERLRQLIEDFPDTKAASEARALLGAQ